MTSADAPQPNVRQAVPFFMVTDIQRSVRYYVDDLGFAMTKQWTPEGKLRWCWLEIGSAAIMLQESHEPLVSPGIGVSICFQCEDALAIYRDLTARGVEAKRPFVGNAMWVTSVTDPDGYRLDFESPTNAPEESEYEDAG
jgi:lactoylglutathione lyase